jgi:hypothetical protein
MPNIESDPGTPVEVSRLIEPLAPAKVARPRGKRRAVLVADAAGTEKPMSHVMQLIAALKAEQETPPAERSVASASTQATAPADEPTEPINVLSSLRDILAAREQERGLVAHEQERSEAEKRARSLEGELIEARAVIQASRDAAAQAEAEHRRIIADLKLLHEHQRSIWQLERRRLEITERQKKTVKRAVWLAWPALVAGLLIVLLALAMLSGDSGEASGSTPAGNPSWHHPAFVQQQAL